MTRFPLRGGKFAPLAPHLDVRTLRTGLNTLMAPEPLALVQCYLLLGAQDTNLIKSRHAVSDFEDLAQA
jgi:hypothetical protein